ncbi:MAG: DNA-directed RNA polymerase subunit RpoH/Rpb5 C-terminal domain-containing protein [Candidatus Poseidoniia archaeon]|nr:DNA-directed RNA polymerase subunit RpoH/Rpb5 C-terminal domain-containing protein [Candidatus Poseidoniia archaeon]MDP7255459.1 DNA-directed RNA polymerase subunit RpoH/Rpb5 C-terminal domain-containing protein [Candidatus Poseidoniia archaeon]MDP7473452.1 DNA-directed RNA polymerase subunit RpoH/Rpb5 C-terminal domain-containing protein [Candidatus Poseidoniia archaeon]MDP7589155.1 DNA-directed RNA polymerase subunit RpoH/Rpb5 C-terminal domain-containing protein [Candidatus Poseidoniia arc
MPRHRRLEPEQAAEKLAKLNIVSEQLPKILKTDSAVQALGDDIATGDVIEIERTDERAGFNLAYRKVVE